MKKCVLTFLLGLTLIGICACANDTSKEATSSVETVIEEARQKGATEISLDATDMGRTLYEALGFMTSDSGMVMELN